MDNRAAEIIDRLSRLYKERLSTGSVDWSDVNAWYVTNCSSCCGSEANQNSFDAHPSFSSDFPHVVGQEPSAAASKCVLEPLLHCYRRMRGTQGWCTHAQLGADRQWFSLLISSSDPR